MLIVSQKLLEQERVNDIREMVRAKFKNQGNMEREIHNSFQTNFLLFQDKLLHAFHLHTSI